LYTAKALNIFSQFSSLDCDNLDAELVVFGVVVVVVSVADVALVLNWVELEAKVEADVDVATEVVAGVDVDGGVVRIVESWRGAGDDNGFIEEVAVLVALVLLGILGFTLLWLLLLLSLLWLTVSGLWSWVCVWVGISALNSNDPVLLSLILLLMLLLLLLLILLLRLLLQGWESLFIFVSTSMFVGTLVGTVVDALVDVLVDVLAGGDVCWRVGLSGEEYLVSMIDVCEM
jgi:hypothetical protein